MFNKIISEKCFSPARWCQAVVCVSCLLACAWLMLVGAGCRDDGGAILITAEALPQETTTEVFEGTMMEAQSTTTEEQTTTAAAIYVHVCGQVAVAGVYALPEGSRVWDAVAAAGGTLPEAAADAVNLAMLVADGSKVTIPDREEAGDNSFRWYETEGKALTIGGAAVGESSHDNSEHSTPEGASGGATGLIDINRADVAALMTIPGIGQTRAEAIVSHRQTQGPFGSIEEIMEVSGIKEGLFARIKEYITVGG